MKSLVAVLLFLVSFLAAAQPAATVRVMSAKDGDKFCSAVVIAPNYALTARHCSADNILVDGVLVAHATAPLSVIDIALLYAPGLKCPCAALGARPAVGDSVIAIGFPGVLQGAQRTTAPAKVRHVGSPAAFSPWMRHPESLAAMLILTDKAILQTGDSGGGLFALRDGAWFLIGINAVGIPDGPGGTEISSGFTPVDMADAFLPKKG